MHRFFLSAICFVCSVSWAHAEFKLQDAQKLAARQNPEIVAQEKYWRQSQAQARLTRRWLSPEVSYETMYSAREKIIGVAQTIPFPGKLWKAGKVADWNVEKNRLAWKAKEREVSARVTEAFVRYALSSYSSSQFEASSALLEVLAKSARSQYIAGKMPQSEYLRIELMKNEWKAEAQNLNDEKKLAWSQLSVAVGRPLVNLASQTVVMPELPNFPENLNFAQIVDKAHADHPEHLAALAEIAMAKEDLSLAKAQIWPDLTLGYRRRNADEPQFDNTHDWRLAAMIPLDFGKNTAQITAAKEKLLASEAQIKNLTIQSEVELEMSWTEYRKAKRLAELWKNQQIPLTEQIAKGARADYAAGKNSLSSYLEAEKLKLEAEQKYVLYTSQAWQALAHMQHVVGAEILSTIAGEKP